eukprot:c47269_g1_i1 orf=3-401(+)
MMMVHALQPSKWPAWAHLARAVPREPERACSRKGLDSPPLRHPQNVSTDVSGLEWKSVSRGFSGRQEFVTERKSTRLKERCVQEPLKEEAVIGQWRRDIRVDFARYASLLRHCGDVRSLRDGKLVHNQIIRA